MRRSCRNIGSSVLLLLMVMLMASGAFGAGPLVTGVQVQGNEHVVADHILSVIQTRGGDPLDRELLRKDVEAIYSLGFFALVDVDLQPRPDGVNVVFVIRENPVVENVGFQGNTVFTEDQLKEAVFTTPGNVFNRVFFQHDLQRIREKYQDEGYVLMRVEDVSVTEGNILVTIIEPRVESIIIQGNTKTETYVIERRLKMKPGDLFNSKSLRKSLNTLQGMGYFEDVSVGFEPTEDPAMVTLVLTVEEKRTGRVTFNIGYGSSSGWQGGLGYEDPNWHGRGQHLNVGFDTGDREEYWASFSDPYMDKEVYAWNVGFTKRTWDELDYHGSVEENGSRTSKWAMEYDESAKAAYIGLGRKFGRNEEYHWYATLDWKESDIAVRSYDIGVIQELGYDTIEDFKNDRLLDGKVFSITGKVQRTNMAEYSAYPRGDIESLTVEQALETLGGEYSFTKWWLEAKYYTPILGVRDVIGSLGSLNEEENPIIFAARVRAGWSSGTLPWVELYSLGGDSTLRGFDSEYFKGDEMLLGNFELRLPVEDSFSLVLFYDTGKAWDSRDGESMSFSDLADNYGFGVRVKTPIGNIRLDVAEGDDETRTIFSMGELF